MSLTHPASSDHLAGHAVFVGLGTLEVGERVEVVLRVVVLLRFVVVVDVIKISF